MLWLAAGLCLAACSDDGVPAPAPAEAVLPVSLATVAPAFGANELRISGTVRLKRETALGFNAPGRIAAITVLEGEQVRQGQVLARLDLTSLDASTSTAQAELVRAQADHARLQGLFDKGWVTAPRVETARASLDSARARLRQTRFDEGLGVIRAPSSGTVLRRPLEPGQIVQPGQTVLVVGEASSGMVLRLPVADGDVARLRLGQPATVVLPALGDAPIIATVSEIGARGDDATGTFRVELSLPASANLRSGLIGEARLMLSAPPQGVAGSAERDLASVPATALFSVRADEGFVYVHDAATGRVRLRQVAVGAVRDNAVIITGGLKQGEHVVTSGPDRLRDGMRVKVAA
ncbi:multidrug transporter [Polymorphobacter multimanifer]|nr:multidrug transporter [Polymorphobacter multimanifer]